MASKPVTLLVEPRGKPIKKLPQETSSYLQASTADLYHRLAAEAGVSPDRIRITKGSDGTLVPNAKDFTVERTGLRNKSVVYVKDLGPQIAWQTVFVIEYFGPLIIHPLVYLLRPYIFKNAGPASQAQTLSCVLITLHFLKRELETLFVHRFSNATMPARNIFKNSAHYWLLAGANIAFWSYKPGSPTAKLHSPLIIYPALALFVVGELGNLSTHLTLRGLRSAGGKERGIPKGLGFDLVTCPNYMFETVAWVGMWLMTFSLSTGLFVVIAVAQMYLWAIKKEKRYRQEFGDKYKKKRCAMVPFVA
ncbi:hypothetical protein CAC42_4732 [Sphaceloma murrayae]|uniref:very-long-chain enoyl-CoA reductase n=1 Tax=Sphaceloma murrayae TaxID=2082308 RepID=A0A2K1QNR0_9PEZI|nr:hypothetical protein CAC42_4732 [Sphaceloma murrayae]